MIAYQVKFNGAPVATAGLTQGVVSGIANWIFIPTGTATEPSSDWKASFSIGGLDDKSQEQLQWFRTDLKLGDEITLKLVEVDEVDTPTQLKHFK